MGITRTNSRRPFRQGLDVEIIIGTGEQAASGGARTLCYGLSHAVSMPRARSATPAHIDLAHPTRKLGYHRLRSAGCPTAAIFVRPRLPSKKELAVPRRSQSTLSAAAVELKSCDENPFRYLDAAAVVTVARVFHDAMARLKVTELGPENEERIRVMVSKRLLACAIGGERNEARLMEAAIGYAKSMN